MNICSSDSASERNGIKVDTRVREMSSGRRGDSTRGREENVREAEEDRVESYRRVSPGRRPSSTFFKC